ncbi:hypothetical protein WNY78_06855 [Psychroserpens sp. AS72]|uniref:hypothetical protein n=1 Tax=Psychroserpens sp. AS72 TaxID=3135775 RepID=UPI00317D2F7A
MKFFIKYIYKINKDFIIIACILLLPFAFYLYNIAPKTKTWRNSLFEINSGDFDDVNYYLWFLCVKVLTLMLLTLWYLTCTQKWRVLLLVSIILEIFKFFSLVKIAKLGYEHEVINILDTLCYSIPYVIVLILISRKLNYYESYKNEIAPLNDEISRQLIKLTNLNRKQYKSMGKELRKLETQKLNMNKKEYLTKLIELRDQLTISN